MKEKVVLIGAGSVVFTRGLIADLLESGWEADLVLVDIDPEALRVAHALAEKMVAARGASVRVTSSVDRRDALRGATAVIATIGVGGRRAWEQDVFVPRRYGIYQPVGDTVMPGGASRALRMIPAMVAIARDVGELAPDAVFFNYANPMSAICRGVRKATGVPMVGLCHGVPSVARYLAGVLEVDSRELSYTAVGVNHLTWFTEIYQAGRDMMARLRELAARAVREGVTPWGDAPPDAGAGHVAWGEPFSWRLMHTFGAFPACLDRHVVEFFPGLFRAGRYRGKTLGVDAIPFEPVIEDGDRGYDEMRRSALSGGELPSDYFSRGEGEHEQVLEVLESIRTDAGGVYSANLPNRGQVPNLPAEAIIEAPARASASGLRPLVQPPLPDGLVGTLASRLQWVEVVVEAALTGSRDLFIEALVLDGSVDSIDTAARLADDLLAAQAAYLPQFR